MRAGLSAAEKFGCTRGKKHLSLPWTVHASCWLNFDSSLIWLTNQIQLNWLISPEMGKKVTVLFHFVSQNLSLETINDSSTLQGKVHSKQKCDFFQHWENISYKLSFTGSLSYWEKKNSFWFDHQMTSFSSKVNHGSQR